MKIKTTAIIFALFMAIQFIASAQTGDVKADNSKAVVKQPVQKEVAVEKQAAPAVIDANKSDASATAPCCKGKTEAACTGHKDGSKECCKDKSKSGEGCKDKTEGKKSDCGHKHGEAKSSDCKGQTKATGDIGDTRSSKGCCHR